MAETIFTPQSRTYQDSSPVKGKAEKETDSKTKTPLYPVLQDSSPEDLILSLPYQAPPLPSAPPLQHQGLQKGLHPSLTREFLCASQQQRHTNRATGWPHLQMWGRPTPLLFPSTPWGLPWRPENNQCYIGRSPPVIYIIGEPIMQSSLITRKI